MECGQYIQSITASVGNIWQPTGRAQKRVDMGIDSNASETGEATYYRTAQQQS